MKTLSPGNKELTQEIDKARATAATLAKEEQRGRLPAGTADNYRRKIAAAVREARQKI